MEGRTEGRMNEGECERNGKEGDYRVDAQEEEEEEEEKGIKVIWRESGRKDNVSYRIY